MNPDLNPVSAPLQQGVQAQPSEYLRGYKDGLSHAAFYVRDHCQSGDDHAEAVENLAAPIAQQVAPSDREAELNSAWLAFDGSPAAVKRMNLAIGLISVAQGVAMEPSALFKLIDAAKALQHAADHAQPDMGAIYRKRATEIFEVVSAVAQGVAPSPLPPVGAPAQNAMKPPNLSDVHELAKVHRPAPA